jgi:hypothetical protein
MLNSSPDSGFALRAPRNDGSGLVSLVMAGLDPAIHHLRKKHFRGRWIAGSSPAMTMSDRNGAGGLSARHDWA